MEMLQPPGWARPKGYSNGIAAEGRLVFIAGQVGWDPVSERFAADDFAGQFRQALENILAVLACAGGGPEHIARMTWYVADKAEYLASLAALGGHYRELMGRNYPAMAVIAVAGFVEAGARLEIEATAVVPK